MAKQAGVWTWLLDDLGNFDEDAEYEDYYHWDQREYVTDVFNRRALPPLGALLIGYENTRGVPRLHTLGVVAGHSGVATARVRATIKPLFHHVETPLSTVLRRLPNKLRSETSDFFSAASLRPVQVHNANSKALLEAISRAVPGSRNWLGKIGGEIHRATGKTAYRLREERDAVQTAVSLAGIETNRQLFESTSATPIEHAFQLLRSDIFAENEDDLIFADLRRFDTGGALSEVSGSTSVYQDSRVNLIITNVNRKPLERALGVDLFYWDADKNSYTFVQYKRLSELGRSYDASTDQYADDRWRYTNRADLKEQLARMQSLGSHKPRDATDWRLVDNPFWFKFVRPKEFTSEDQRVISGMYVPSSYLRIGIQKNSFQGPKGGFAFGYWNSRHVTRSVFIELVKSGYAGSTAAGSEEIYKVIERLSPDNQLIIAKSTTESLGRPHPL
ncbi:hypothetical protein [Mycobacteroides chelonae]|uniref:hypothetical protein n=1 Tax=Mycobacteroides chelonae TaxID=1774 RepID=UPI000B0A8A5A|nr:hypothetical protein [Mycobacteroides chelonae]MBF9316378.1 hypothetical protein [Mycobacteroides chelonae]